MDNKVRVRVFNRQGQLSDPLEMNRVAKSDAEWQARHPALPTKSWRPPGPL